MPLVCAYMCVCVHIFKSIPNAITKMCDFIFAFLMWFIGLLNRNTQTNNWTTSPNENYLKCQKVTIATLKIFNQNLFDNNRKLLWCVKCVLTLRTGFLSCFLPIHQVISALGLEPKVLHSTSIVFPADMYGSLFCIWVDNGRTKCMKRKKKKEIVKIMVNS